MLQFGANAHNRIIAHVGKTADRLGVDRRDAMEIYGRIMDMLEVGADRVGSECPACGRVSNERQAQFGTGGFVQVPVCPEHGGFHGRLVIAFPSPDDITEPPL